jgi:UDP-GlcNAc:undecaprenyl-phosphate GlcNAc-1-phosphate transferase
MSLFLLPFLTAFSVSLLLSLLLALPILRHANPRSGGRHQRTRGVSVSRLGGLAIIGAFFFALGVDQHLVMTRPIYGLLAASTFILCFGVIDDFLEIDWKTQVLFQVILGIIAYFANIRIDFVTNPLGGIIDLTQFSGVSFLVTLAWLILIINAVNWLDGADGLLGGVGSIAAITIFCISLRPEVNQPPMAILTALILGAIGGFLLFNMPPARILAGTTGSLFVGFSLAALAIMAGSKIATTLLVLSLPIIDALLVSFRRIFSGDSVFQPDERHIHFRLLRLGWSPAQIFSMVTLFTAFVAFLSLQTSPLLKVFAFFLLMIFFAILYASLDRPLKRKWNEYISR